MLAVSMPKRATSASLVESATKCFATAPSSPSARTHQARASRALVRVSRVVKVFDATTNSVSLGSRARVATEHRLDPRWQPALGGRPEQERQRFAGQPVLRVVEVEAGRLDGQPLAAAGIVGEERPQVDVLDRLVVLSQRAPGRAAGERR